MSVRDRSAHDSFLEYLSERQPVFFKSLEMAQKQGLLIVDEDIDAVSASNRLLFTNDVLQQTLNLMVADWMDYETRSLEHFSRDCSGDSRRMSEQEVELALEKVWAVFDTILEPKLNWNLKDLNLLKSIEVAEDGGLDIRINVVETDPDKLTDFRLHIEEKLARFSIQSNSYRFATH